MAMSRATFRVRFPEFYVADDTVVDAFLAAALARLDATVWGGLLDEGQGYLAAHLMAVSPAGRTAGLSSKDKKGDAYWINYSEMVRLVAGGPVTI